MADVRLDRAVAGPAVPLHRSKPPPPLPGRDSPDLALDLDIAHSKRLGVLIGAPNRQMTILRLSTSTSSKTTIEHWDAWCPTIRDKLCDPDDHTEYLLSPDEIHTAANAVLPHPQRPKKRLGLHRSRSVETPVLETQLLRTSVSIAEMGCSEDAERRAAFARQLVMFSMGREEEGAAKYSANELARLKKTLLLIGDIPVRVRIHHLIVKIGHAAPDSDYSAAARIHNERRILELLSGKHEAFPSLRRWSSDNTIAMSYTHPHDLFTILTTEDDFVNTPRSAYVAAQVVSGMAYAHSLGVYHHDLKLENLVMNAFGLVQIIDWELATSVRQKIQPQSQCCGTASYMPPEVFTADINRAELETQRHVDEWSVGILMYALAKGCLPQDDMCVDCGFQSCDSPDTINPAWQRCSHPMMQPLFPFGPFDESPGALSVLQVKYDDELRQVPDERALILGFVAEIPAERLSMDRALASNWMQLALAAGRAESQSLSKSTSALPSRSARC